MKSYLIFLLFFFSFLDQQVQSQDIDVGINEKKGSTLSNDLYFFNEDSVRVNLKTLIDKPVILSLVYFQCPNVCTPLMNGIADLINETKLKPGKDFDVITLSFNWDEKPDLARKKKQNYLTMLEPGIPEDSWHFLTGDSADIISLARETGFGFYRKDNDIFHSAAIILLSPDAMITEYMNGVEYNPEEFNIAISEAFEGKVSSLPIHKVDYCFNYEPEGRARFRKLFRISIGVILVMLSLVFVFYPPGFKGQLKK